VGWRPFHVVLFNAYPTGRQDRPALGKESRGLVVVVENPVEGPGSTLSTIGTPVNSCCLGSVKKSAGRFSVKGVGDSCDKGVDTMTGTD